MTTAFNYRLSTAAFRPPSSYPNSRLPTTASGNHRALLPPPPVHGCTLAVSLKDATTAYAPPPLDTAVAQRPRHPSRTAAAAVCTASASSPRGVLPWLSRRPAFVQQQCWANAWRDTAWRTWPPAVVVHTVAQRTVSPLACRRCHHVHTLRIISTGGATMAEPPPGVSTTAVRAFVQQQCCANARRDMAWRTWLPVVVVVPTRAVPCRVRTAATAAACTPPAPSPRGGAAIAEPSLGARTAELLFECLPPPRGGDLRC